jgi:hypothetical protein
MDAHARLSIHKKAIVMNATSINQRKAPVASSSSAAAAAGSSNSNSNSAAASTSANVNGKSGSKPTTVEINNVAVHFPFRPYDVQTKYMKSVLDALQKGEHALLESPTVSFFQCAGRSSI